MSNERLPIKFSIAVGPMPDDPGESKNAKQPTVNLDCTREPARKDQLVVHSGDDFLELEIPPREILLGSANSPILQQQSITVINAVRGVGKTFIALAITRALATQNSFLNWGAPRKSRVLYVDGELPATDMQKRWRIAVGKTKNYAHLITLDDQPEGIPSLATPEGQTKLEAAIGKCEPDVLVLDSVSTLFRVEMNEESEVIKIQEWLMKLRSKFRVAVILLNHKGKNPTQGPRGHSRIEDAADLCIELDRPQGYKVSDGLHCELKYTKTRTLVEGAEPVRIQMSVNNGQAVWTDFPAQNDLKAKARELAADGKNQDQIAETLGVSQTTVSRWLKSNKPYSPCK